MKVALYYPWIYLTSGAERTILELTADRRHEWTIFTNRFEQDSTFPGFRNRRIVQLDSISVKRTVAGAGAGALKILTQRLPLEGYEALVVVCEGFGDLSVFRNSSLPILCVCLTPLRIAFDPSYRSRCLVKYGPLARPLIRFGSWAFKPIDRRAWRRYCRVFCISEEVKRRVIDGGLAASDRIEVAHPGLGFEPGTPSETFEKFFLLPGRIMWTKNIELAIDSFRSFRHSNPQFSDFRLVIAGIVDRKSEGYFQGLRAITRELGDAVEFRIHPSDSELSTLYQNCYATLFTAFNEDWGIVPLESMAFGKPAICVNRGGPRESVNDAIDGFLVEPAAEAFAERMAALAGNPDMCRRMGRAGNRNVRRFTWPNFTRRIDDAIQELGQSHLRTSNTPAPIALNRSN